MDYKKRLSDFIILLSDLNCERDIERLCKEEINFLRNHYDIYPIYNEKGVPYASTGSVSTLKNRLTTYRNAIRKLPLNENIQFSIFKNNDIAYQHLALKYLRLDGYEMFIFKNNQKHRIYRDSVERPTFNVEMLIEKALDCLDSSSFTSKVVGLYLLTGRRHIELLVKGFFDTPIYNVSPISDWLTSVESASFHGQAKSKHNVYIPAYDIPILCSLTIIKNEISYLRKNVPHRHDEAARGGKRLNLFVKKEFEETGILTSPNGSKSLTLHNLRSAYSAINWYKYVNSNYYKGMTEEIFIKTVMGHSSDDITSANSYKDYYIK